MNKWNTGLISGIITNIALVAQWIEYLTSNQLVARSTRAGGTKQMLTNIMVYK